LERLLSEIREKERDAFTVLDSYVRSGELTRKWMLETMAQYGKPISQATFTRWQRLGLVEMERGNRLKPLSAQALLMMRMIDPGERGFLPAAGLASGDSWWCYIQERPETEVIVWPVARLGELPPATLCWTPTASAVWEPGWYLLGAQEETPGCMRFAGLQRCLVRGQVWYDIHLEELARWDAAVAALSVTPPWGSETQVQALIFPAFHRLAASRFRRFPF
jgi:hypothetical protein